MACGQWPVGNEETDIRPAIVSRRNGEGVDHIVASIKEGIRTGPAQIPIAQRIPGRHGGGAETFIEGDGEGADDAIRDRPTRGQASQADDAGSDEVVDGHVQSVLRVRTGTAVGLKADVIITSAGNGAVEMPVGEIAIIVEDHRPADGQQRHSGRQTGAGRQTDIQFNDIAGIQTAEVKNIFIDIARVTGANRTGSHNCSGDGGLGLNACGAFPQQVGAGDRVVGVIGI